MKKVLPGNIEPDQRRKLPWEDIKSFESFYKEHFVRLTVFCEGIMGDKDLAAQLVQEAFFKIWDTRDKITGVANPAAYLYQTVRNVAIDYIRKFKQELQVSPDYDEAQEEPDEIPVSEEIVPYIKQAAQKLPEKCRIIFEMSFLEGISKEEIAGYLNISPLTVKKQRVIALKKIREELLPIVNKLLLLIWLLK